MNVGSEEIPDINSTEIEEALSQLKNGRAPGEDKITSEMIKLGGTTTMESMKILMNKCLHIGNIPRTWQNVQVILLHKKGLRGRGFRKGHSTEEHIQTLRTLIEKCIEYNTLLHLAFIDFNKAFDSVELWDE